MSGEGAAARAGEQCCSMTLRTEFKNEQKSRGALQVVGVDPKALAPVRLCCSIERLHLITIFFHQQV
jgi:hypothetical protein